MNLQEIKDVAKIHGVKTGQAKKAELVRMIQSAEGNHPRFQDGQAATCGQDGCLWRGDCD
ncbi:MAG: SAP domain-containing protein [Desulfuromonadales bacterium]|nr:SAP domain-containing protein [Desulfuromonadales bacterium]